MRKMVKEDYRTRFKAYPTLEISNITSITVQGVLSIKMVSCLMAIFEWEESTAKVKSKIINRIQLFGLFGRMVR